MCLGVYVYMWECVCKGHKGRGSMVRCHLMTDSNRLKTVHLNLLSFHVHCLKRKDNSSKVTCAVCFYCFTPTLQMTCPLLFIFYSFKMSSCIVKFYRDTFTAFSGLGYTIKAHASSQNPLTVCRMSESSCCIWTGTQNLLSVSAGKTLGY